MPGLLALAMPLAFAMIGLFDGTASGQTLPEALAQAYRTNPQLEAGRSQLRATDEQLPIATSNWRPTVQLSATYGKNRSLTRSDSRPIFNSGQTSELQDGAVTITQPLYRGGRTVAATAQATDQIEAERARLAATEQTVLLNAATAFMDVYRNQVLVDLNKKNVQILRQELQSTRTRLLVNDVTKADLAQAEARLSRAIADLDQAQGNLKSAAATYQHVIGSLPGRLVEPTERLVEPPSNAEAIKLAVAGSPSIGLAFFTRKAAENNVDLVTGELLPEASLQAGYVYSNTITELNLATPSVGRSLTKQLTAKVTVPVYEAGSVYARSRGATQTVGQREKELEDVRRQVVEFTTANWQALQSARASIIALLDNIRAAEIALSGVKDEAQTGTRSVIDVLNAEEELFNSEVQLANKKHDETVTGYRLRLALGTLNAQALALPVPAYDPKPHLEAVRHKWIGLTPPK
jgi:outer membrane protein